MKPKTIQFWILWRRIKSLFTRNSGSDDFFVTNYKPNPDEFMRLLIPLGYQYNYFSHHYKDQICNVRRWHVNEKNEIWQYHLRLYNHGTVTGHYELTYEQDALGHIHGEGLVEIPQIEKDKIIGVLNTITI